MTQSHGPRDRRWQRRAVFAAAILLPLLVWGWVDVRVRAQVDPRQPARHRSDLTVYTEAGLAFFDGRPPYEVTNPRGWHYLYPPLFALVVAPLGALDTEWQAFVWFCLSLVMGWGAIREARLLLRRLPGGDTGKSGRGLLLALACAAATPAALNCLQRGQVGIAIVYFLLLGFRLVLTGRTARTRFLGGIALALPVAIKLTPILPAGVLLLIELIRSSRHRFAAAFAGGMAGLAAFFLIIPSGLIGWGENLHHLHTWLHRVVLSDAVADENDFNAKSGRNQSLANAAYRCGNYFGRVVGGGPEDRYVGAPFYMDRQQPMLMDAAWVGQATYFAIGALCTLFLGVVVRRLRGDELDMAATVGVACVLTLVASPLSWGHHFIILLPGVLLFSLWSYRCHGVIAAAVWAAVPLALLWTHYLALSWAGRCGLLGIGVAIWSFAACISLLRRRVCHAKHSAGLGQKPAAALRSLAAFIQPPRRIGQPQTGADEDNQLDRIGQLV
jgi:hypothetical protein